MDANVTQVAVQAGAASRGPTDPREKARLEKAVRDFEAVFVGYMLKSMRDSIPKDDMLSGGFGGDVMESMFDSELSRQMSLQSNLGLAELLYRGITGEHLPARPASLNPGRGTPLRVPSESARPGRSAPISGGSPASAKTIEQRVEAFAPFIEDSARRHGVDANLLRAVIASESAGDTGARSSKDAKGLMQLMDSTATAMGVRNVWDPKENIEGGAKYLGELLERFDGNVEHAVASYNAGPGAVIKHGGVPPFRETRDFVSRVMDFFSYFGQQEDGADDQN